MCGIVKELNLFYKHKQMGDGHLNKCIECTKKDTANNDKVYSNKTIDSYDRTEKGVIRVMYKTQVRNSKVRKMDLPNYTKQEFKQAVLNGDVLFGNFSATNKSPQLSSFN